MQPTTSPPSICSGRVRFHRERVGAAAGIAPLGNVMTAMRRSSSLAQAGGSGRLPRGRKSAGAAVLAQALFGEADDFVDVIGVFVDVEGKTQQIAADA